MTTTTNCGKCQALTEEILKQINAFQTMASVNSNMSWTILVQSLQRILPSQATKQGEPLEVPAGINEQEEEEENSNIEGQESNVGAENVHEIVDALLNGNSVVDFDDPTVSPPKSLLTPGSLKEADEFIRVQEVDSQKVYECQICGAGIKSRWNSRLHVRRVHYRERFQCPQCPRTFYSDHKLAIHRRASACSTASVNLWGQMIQAKETFERLQAEYQSQIQEPNSTRKKAKKRKRSLSGPSSPPNDSIPPPDSVQIIVKVEPSDLLPPTPLKVKSKKSKSRTSGSPSKSTAKESGEAGEGGSKIKKTKLTKVELKQIDDKIRAQLIFSRNGGKDDELMDGSYECIDCSKSYTNLPGIRYHIRVSHLQNVKEDGSEM